MIENILEDTMKSYLVRIEERITYEVEVMAHDSKDAELEAYRHPEKWQEQTGVLKLIDIKQGGNYEYQDN
jgi:hypothetical protein